MHNIILYYYTQTSVQRQTDL